MAKVPFAQALPPPGGHSSTWRDRRSRVATERSDSKRAAARCGAERRFEDTDWIQILEWHDELLRFADTPIIRLDRAVALGEADGAPVGLTALGRHRREHPAPRGGRGPSSRAQRRSRGRCPPVPAQPTPASPAIRVLIHVAPTVHCVPNRPRDRSERRRNLCRCSCASCRQLTDDIRHRGSMTTASTWLRVRPARLCGEATTATVPSYATASIPKTSEKKGNPC